MTFRSSKFGAAFDLIGDALVYVFFFLSLPYDLYRASGRRIWLVLGLIVFVSMLIYYLTLIHLASLSKARPISSKGSAGFLSETREFGKNVRGNGIRVKVAGIAAQVSVIFRRELFATGALLILVFAGAKALMLLSTVLYPLQAVFMGIQLIKAAALADRSDNG